MSSSGNARRSKLLEVAEQVAQRAMACLQTADLRADDAHALLTLWFLAVTDVLGLTVQELQTEVGRFARSMCGWSWMDVVKVLKKLDGALLHLEAPTDSYTSFKRWCSQQCEATTVGASNLRLPAQLVRSMFLGIKDQDPDAFRRAHQFFQFPLRGDIITDKARKVLKRQGVDKFRECESRLANGLPADVGWSPFFWDYLSGWNPYKDLICRISSGSAIVCGQPTKKWWDKWDALSIAEAYYVEYFAGKVFPTSGAHISEDLAVFFQVPKSSDALRGITIEPAGKAFLQQGFMKSLRRYIGNHPYLRRRFDPKRPEKSAALARQGSIDGSFATIDLSDASDSVTLEYLERVAWETDFLEAILLARTNHIRLPDGTVMPLVKYGGMGNALTFTIESLVFASLIEEGIRDVRGSVPKSRYRVYGDDLVVEDRYYESVCSRLTSSGFIVNQSKSFSTLSGSPFREACGGEYFRGHDVKPVRVPRKEFRKIDHRIPAEAIQGYVELANSASGVLPSVRWAIIVKLKEFLPQHLWPVFSSDGSEGLMSPCATNYHLKVSELSPEAKARRDWHYTHVMTHGGIREVTKSATIDEYVRYEHTLLSLAARRQSDEPYTVAELIELQEQSQPAAYCGDVWGVVKRYI